jgi:hypothetical protein
MVYCAELVLRVRARRSTNNKKHLQIEICYPRLARSIDWTPSVKRRKPPQYPIWEQCFSIAHPGQNGFHCEVEIQLLSVHDPTTPELRGRQY